MESHSAKQTEQLAASLGSRLRGGEVIELVSDLGGGKTTFVRGLARGLGSKDRVSSPSFTIRNQYQAADKILNHFDFYRLNQPGVLRDELAEIMTDRKAVSVIEWGDIVQDVLPTDRLTISFKVTGNNSRRLQFKSSVALNYLKVS